MLRNDSAIRAINLEHQSCRGLMRWLTLWTILLSFALRMYALGADSFWNDEAGQAFVTIQTDINGILNIARSHAMAMPLDYLVTATVGQLGHTEGVLRLPSVFWSILASLLYLAFVKKVCQSQAVALLTIYILGLSPIHIQYAQELRFYAALLFFSIASNLVLLRACRESRLKNWLIYVTVTGIGAYFHPYVLFTAINGVAYLLLNHRASLRKGSKVFGQLVLSSLSLALIFLPGYLYFAGNENFQYDLLPWGGTILNNVRIGMGWRSVSYSPTLPVHEAWHWVLVVLSILGIITVFARFARNSTLIAFVIGSVLQIGVILLADWVKGYWFTYRQLIHLAPVFMILAAIGLDSAISYVQRSEVQKKILLILSLILLSVAVFSSLTTYYSFEKSNGRLVTDYLLQTYQSPLPVYIIPGYEEKIYRWYLLQHESDRGILEKIVPLDWDTLTLKKNESQSASYLLLPVILSTEEQGTLSQLGYHQVYKPAGNWRGSRAVWITK